MLELLLETDQVIPRIYEVFEHFGVLLWLRVRLVFLPFLCFDQIGSVCVVDLAVNASKAAQLGSSAALIAS